ncbi:MAG TPA: succinylglutamate desuccinylase/aspartoacylase family protein [Paraburkholderia sp.]|jgi:predicted deacylase|nr:succinylglutamate desuccinylase/aspartoacylase family protein [Paraburkholderia sp.]
MHIRHQPLISPALGTSRQITSFHYGPGGAKKVYIQASVHADELPAMLVAWTLRRRLAELEAAGRLRGEIVVVPVANPIGLNQHQFGHLYGRFDTNSAQNFNRNFHDLASLVPPSIDAQLTSDETANRDTIRAAIGDALRAQQPKTELGSQRLALQRLSYDADIVLDLHCDLEAALHLYTTAELWPHVEPLARYLDAKASLLVLNSIGNPFEEIHSFCWSRLRERFGARFPIPLAAISVTIEFRGQHDVTYDLAARDADAIVEYLTLRGVIDGTPAPLPPLAHDATPLAGTEPVVAPASGVLVFRAQTGAWLEAGSAVADIVDPLTDDVVTLRNTVAGVMYARHGTRFATAGMEVARIAGDRPIRGGSLLSQ